MMIFSPKIPKYGTLPHKDISVVRLIHSSDDFFNDAFFYREKILIHKMNKEREENTKLCEIPAIKNSQ